MKEIQTELGKMKIYFRYIVPKNNRERRSFCKRVLAIIEHNGLILTTGLSSCSPRDQFIKEEGRKMALKNAMRDIFNRNIRKELWTGYFNRNILM